MPILYDKIGINGDIQPRGQFVYRHVAIRYL